MVLVVNSNMIKAIRLVSVERGLDTREFSLIAFGGAGPVHAAALAHELNIPRVIVPFAPGVFLQKCLASIIGTTVLRAVNVIPGIVIFGVIIFILPPHSISSSR